MLYMPRRCCDDCNVQKTKKIVKCNQKIFLKNQKYLFRYKMKFPLSLKRPKVNVKMDARSSSQCAKKRRNQMSKLEVQKWGQFGAHFASFESKTLGASCGATTRSTPLGLWPGLSGHHYLRPSTEMPKWHPEVPVRRKRIKDKDLVVECSLL